MKVMLHGETLDFYDNESIRAHARSHAIKVIAALRGKRLRSEFEKFFADIYFLNVKAGGVMAFHVVRQDEQMPVAEYEEILVYLRRVLGEKSPTVNATLEEIPADTSATPQLEIADDYRSRRDPAGDEGAGAEGGGAAESADHSAGGVGPGSADAGSDAGDRAGDRAAGSDGGADTGADARSGGARGVDADTDTRASAIDGH